MSKFLAYLRNDKGGMVEWALMSAGAGAVIIAASSSTTVRTAANGMVETMFNNAKNKSTM